MPILADTPTLTMAELGKKSTKAPGSLDKLAIAQELKDIQARLFRVQNRLPKRSSKNWRD
ncbi:MAG: hypothetical protein DA408_10825 [Bacteroidetes bacterium]|nr:MAG: hypothetical protein C7N36_16695 [Bacteroidota bacterium]PTM12348.1 MAG: hypothetical protein DA408_10825 [Bacteroidota bacterium]